MPVTGGPYLTAAYFCEKVLREQDGVLSTIRIVDRWTVNGPTEAMPLTVIQASIVVLLKSGLYRGTGRITATPISPSNQRMEPIILPVVFGGDDDNGGGAVLPIGFPAQEDGLYWFEISLEGQGLPAYVVTCIPMRVVYLRIGPTLGRPSPPASPGG